MRLVRGTGYPGSLLVPGLVAGAPYQERMRRVCEEAVRRSGMEGRVTFTGFISDVELDTLLRRAACLAYPSQYEGFGIPVLEAMFASTPVLTSSTTALPKSLTGRRCWSIPWTRRRSRPGWRI